MIETFAANVDVEAEAAYARRFAAYRYNPVAFGQDIFSATYDQWQKEVLWSLAHGQKVSCAGARSVGKGYVIATAAWWFVTCFYRSKVSIISASATTLKANVWGDISELYRRSPDLQELFELGTLTIKSRDLPLEWFVRARSVGVRYSSEGGEKQAEGIAGMYAVHTLTLADEATGIDDAILLSAEASANTATRKIAYFFNPHRTSGRAWETQNKATVRCNWECFNIDYTMSSQTTTPDAVAIRRAWIAEMGEQHPWILANVYAKWPRRGTGLPTVFTEEQVMTAAGRYVADDPTLPLDVGLDAARYDNDEWVWLARRGWAFLEMGRMVFSRLQAESGGAQPSVHVIGALKAMIRRLFGLEEGAEIPPEVRRMVRFRVDEGGGYGGGVIDGLRSEGYRVAGVENGARASSEKARKRYANRGTELWMDDGRRAIQYAGMTRLSARDLSTLTMQLYGREHTYEKTAGARAILVSKDVMRKSGLGSPDQGDAWILCVADHRKMRGLVNIEDTIAVL